MFIKTVSGGVDLHKYEKGSKVTIKETMMTPKTQRRILHEVMTRGSKVSQSICSRVFRVRDTPEPVPTTVGAKRNGLMDEMTGKEDIWNLDTWAVSAQLMLN